VRSAWRGVVDIRHPRLYNKMQRRTAGVVPSQLQRVFRARHPATHRYLIFTSHNRSQVFPARKPGVAFGTGLSYFGIMCGAAWGGLVLRDSLARACKDGQQYRKKQRARLPTRGVMALSELSTSFLDFRQIIWVQLHCCVRRVPTISPAGLTGRPKPCIEPDWKTNGTG
jgi:hypothetical protein